MERCVPNAGLGMGREVEAEQILKQNFQEKLTLITYLIFVTFFTQAKFLGNKIYTEKTRKLYAKIHRKLPIFCVITAKYTVNCQFFALNL